MFLEYLGEEAVEIPLGRFDCRHFRFTDEAGGMVTDEGAHPRMTSGLPPTTMRCSCRAASAATCRPGMNSQRWIADTLNLKAYLHASPARRDPCHPQS
jgi:hypothetical protein